MMTAYQKLGFDIRDYPNAYRQYANEITLPLHTLLDDEDVKYVGDCLKKAIDSLLIGNEEITAAG
jgi:dTDP-4-amino-4,6-dideoxygalactose transaminase